MGAGRSCEDSTRNGSTFKSDVYHRDIQHRRDEAQRRANNGAFMPATEFGFDQKHIFLFTLDRAARMFLEGVGDLNEREVCEVQEPVCAPFHILECAIDAVRSTNEVLQNEDAHHGNEAPSDLRQLYKAHTRRLLNYLSELPGSAFATAVTPSVKLTPMKAE